MMRVAVSGLRARLGYAVAWALACAIASAAAGCTPAGQWAEGLNESTVPDDIRPDYLLFAQRCSKCHSLARPLGSGITDDTFWRRYVERMRRQPGSGISPEDETPILRFLHYYSLETLKRKQAGG
jgi:hypothetical protein